MPAPCSRLCPEAGASVAPQSPLFMTCRRRIWPSISRHYLASACSMRRGARRGGYRLARPADEITLWDIERAILGSEARFVCQNIRLSGPCAAFSPHCETLRDCMRIPGCGGGPTAAGSSPIPSRRLRKKSLPNTAPRANVASLVGFASTRYRSSKQFRRQALDLSKAG